jgi:glycolate oxidase
MGSAEVLAALAAALPAEVLIRDPDIVRGLSHDDAEWAPVGEPIALVRAASSAEVAATVRICAGFGVPVTARGAGTGLSGGANAIDGGVIIALDRLNRISAIDPLERLAVVQAGVINDDLRTAAATYGLWYPPDPASSPWSTIGGNIATNAGGVCCVKYGVTRDYVLALEVVTGTGELVRLGRVTAKGVAGYDLVGLMVGSEGTLGIITEATVRLRPLPAAPRTIVGYFGSIVDAGEAARAVSRAGIIPSALELIDRHCLAAVDKWKNMGLSVEADVVLLGRIDDPGAAGDERAAEMLQCFENAGATWAAMSSDEEEAEALFAARRLAYPALERLGPVLTEDVCVPIGAVPEMLARIEQTAGKHDILIANIAHIGDGNLHPLLIADAGDTAAQERAKLAFEEILTGALDLGGTVTGEHGVGLLKRAGLSRELSPAVLDMHRAVKAALDPHNILNPGKVF